MRSRTDDQQTKTTIEKSVLTLLNLKLKVLRESIELRKNRSSNKKWLLKWTYFFKENVNIVRITRVVINDYTKTAIVDRTESGP